MKRLVAIAFAGALLFGGLAGAARASAQTDVVATVHQFIDGFNRGDVKSALAACAPSTSIVDEFPPHQWSGPGACATWAAAYDADAKKNGITDGIVTLQAPWHVDVTGDRAYAVMPANYTYKQNGKPVTETGSVLTVVLEKLPAGWRITSWAWARH
ncbi:MAG TPA: nuclear transport factor 2 family protein [Candidatus Acidoferrales bacterium]|nr:nuclear transport factor 2 family protein [Candidatus Acidoferrales bacterium]